AHRPSTRRARPSRVVAGERAHRIGARRPGGSRRARRSAARRVAPRRRDRGAWRAILPLHAATSHMIAFTDVRVRYPRQARDALNGVSVAAPRGEITAVVGPNGSGKSTLVRALLGRVALAGGAISLDGADVRGS